MQMLRAQMNPHFMFNTLNSINSFIISNRTSDASRYLTSFSKLMRNILENSTKQLISLEKEIKTLTLYIELESARLEHSFDYIIQVASDIDKENTMIPPMLIQPFVENAIWHGIAGKKEQGKITINIKALPTKHIQVIITDNGIGREKSLARKNKQRGISYGTQIVHDRLLLHHVTNRLEIIDLHDKNQQASGTKIVLTIYKELDDENNDNR